MRLTVLGSPLRVRRLRGVGLRGFGGLGALGGHSRRIVRGGWFIHLEKQLYLRTCLGATGRVYDVADASGRLLAPVSCTNMCDIDSMRLERHDSGLRGDIRALNRKKCLLLWID